MTTRIFIDGEAGTTGLQIRQRLESNAAVTLVSIEPARRKDPEAKREILQQADAVVLCLHDDAARETVAMVDALKAAGQSNVRIVDASTAHRVAPGWVYGFAELCAGQREVIADADRVANPGCYATGAIALLRPLIDAGLLAPDAAVCLPSVSGYSGGGRAMIEAYEAGEGAPFELYALGLSHKHLPEIMHCSGLTRTPLFVPSVGAFAQGMLVQLPLQQEWLRAGADADTVLSVLQTHYSGSEWVRVVDGRSQTKLNATALADQDGMELHVFGNAANGQILLVARLDNLGKGASGAAVQNLQIMFGW